MKYIRGKVSTILATLMLASGCERHIQSDVSVLQIRANYSLPTQISGNVDDREPGPFFDITTSLSSPASFFENESVPQPRATYCAEASTSRNFPWNFAIPAIFTSSGQTINVRTIHQDAFDFRKDRFHIWIKSLANEKLGKENIPRLDLHQDLCLDFVSGSYSARSSRIYRISAQYLQKALLLQ